MRVCPRLLAEVISVIWAIWPRWRSSGPAKLDATVSGLAPGSCACTRIVGKSTCGSGETGSFRNARHPASAIPRVRSVVATGRAMKGAERFILGLGGTHDRGKQRRGCGQAGIEKPQRIRPVLYNLTPSHNRAPMSDGALREFPLSL